MGNSKKEHNPQKLFVTTKTAVRLKEKGYDGIFTQYAAMDWLRKNHRLHVLSGYNEKNLGTWNCQVSNAEGGTYWTGEWFKTQYAAIEAGLQKAAELIDKDNRNNNNQKEETTMKEFNLEEAKAGKPVCTRDGRPARIICFDKANDDGLPIIALVKRDDGTEADAFYNIKGVYYGMTDNENDHDLMMAGVKSEGWVNVYKPTPSMGCDFSVAATTGMMVYKTKKDALDFVEKSAEKTDYIATAKICWEE